MVLEPKVERNGVVALLLVGLVARLLVAYWFPVEPAADAITYRDLGMSLALGRGYTLSGIPETIIAPAYPCFLSAVFRLFGESGYAVSVAQAVVDMAGCTLFWLWLRRRCSTEVALISLVLQLASMSAIAAVRIMRAEEMSAFFLSMGLISIDLTRSRRRGWAWAAITGLVLGLLTLTRWNFSLFPIVALAWLFMTRINIRRFVPAALMLCLAYGATLTPWMLRNNRLLGAPVLSTQTGLTLYMSHFRNPGQPYGNNTHDATTAYAETLPPLESSRFLVSETLTRLRTQPTKPFRDYPEKLVYLFVPLDWETLGYRKINFTYAFIALFALLGAIPLWRRDRQLLLLVCAPLAFLVALSFPFYGSPRFRLPTEPPLTAVAAIGLLRLRRLPRSGIDA